MKIENKINSVEELIAIVKENMIIDRETYYLVHGCSYKTESWINDFGYAVNKKDKVLENIINDYNNHKNYVQEVILEILIPDDDSDNTIDFILRGEMTDEGYEKYCR